MHVLISQNCKYFIRQSNTSFNKSLFFLLCCRILACPLTPRQKSKSSQFEWAHTNEIKHAIFSGNRFIERKINLKYMAWSLYKCTLALNTEKDVNGAWCFIRMTAFYSLSSHSSVTDYWSALFFSRSWVATVIYGVLDRLTRIVVYSSCTLYKEDSEVHKPTIGHRSRTAHVLSTFMLSRFYIPKVITFGIWEKDDAFTGLKLTSLFALLYTFVN